jgi:thiamine biosynthesis lipoprotein
MNHQPIAWSRRRFIRLAAATGACVTALSRRTASEAPAAGPYVWRGTALGAATRLELHHPDIDLARTIAARAVAETRRLESIFSLYRPDSAIRELNRRGVLVAPPPEFVELLRSAQDVHRLTGGAFDPTVQPLWHLYAGHFAGATTEAPSDVAIEQATKKVGLAYVDVNEDRIACRRPGMALTFNGIAQGYITDRVADLLRAAGFDHCLVDMGELRALGDRPDRVPWRIGIEDPEAGSTVAQTIEIVDQAVATSGAHAFRFDAAGRFNHLFDPRTGRSASLYRSVTCVMRRATAADALSTAFSLMPQERIAAALRGMGEGKVHIVTADRHRITLQA